MTHAFNAQEKKIIAIGAIIACGFLCFWLFVYMPTRRAAQAMKAKMVQARVKIQDVELIVGRGGEIRQTIDLLDETSRRLEAKFPSQEEVGLRALSDIARKFNITLESVKPEPKAFFLDDSARKTEIDGKVCQQTAVSVTFRCSFKELVRYLEALRNTAPIFVDMEKVKINKDTGGAAGLNVILDINLYSLS